MARKPVDRERFFENYCSRLYDSRTAPEAAAALHPLSKAQQSIQAALGSDNMLRLWDEPFAGGSVERYRSHVEEFRRARLDAEDAQDHLYAAMEASHDSYSLPSLLLGARLIDYAGMKFLYAVEIADVLTKVNSSSTREDVSFWLGTQAADRNHGRMGDLMDTITELRDIYRTMWLAEYTPYRLGSVLGRFDAEFEYWRKLQARTWEAERTYKPGSGAKFGGADSLAEVGLRCVQVHHEDETSMHGEHGCCNQHSRCVLFRLGGRSRSVVARQFIAEGIRLVQQEKLAEAADRFRKAMAADPSNADAANDLGIVLRRQRDFQDAIAAFETARQLRPEEARIQSNLALALDDMGRVAEAVATMQRAYALQPANTTIRQNLCRLQCRLGEEFAAKGDLKNAETQFRSAAEIAGDNYEPHELLGGTLVETGDLDGAEREPPPGD